VAAHRRHDERLAAERPHLVADRLDDAGDVGDAAAAGRDRDARAGLDAAREATHLLARRALDVVDDRRVEALADAVHRRERDVQPDGAEVGSGEHGGLLADVSGTTVCRGGRAAGRRVPTL
jgi:hypothetical protein